MTIPAETISKFTPLERALYDALQQNGILSHAVLQSLGYNISLGSVELKRLNATIHRYNRKVPEEDKLIRSSYGSTDLMLLPVLMRSEDFARQRSGSK